MLVHSYVCVYNYVIHIQVKVTDETYTVLSELLNALLKDDLLEGYIPGSSSNV